MKNILLIVIATCFVSSVSAQDNWIDIKYPSAGLIGVAIHGISADKDLDPQPGEEIADPGITTQNGAAYIAEYQKKYRSFFGQFVNTENSTIKAVKIKNLKIRTLAAKDVIKMKPELMYVYQGISADTLEVTVTTSKKSDIDYSKALNLLVNAASSSMRAGSSAEIKNWLHILDIAKSDKKDSVDHVMMISSSEVFFKVKVVSYEQNLKHDWGSYFKYFVDGNNRCRGSGLFPDQKKNLRNYAGEKETLSRYPDFWGPKDVSNVKAKLGVEKVNGELLLYAYYTPYKHQNTSGDKWEKVALPSAVDQDGRKYWDLEDFFLYSFYFKGVEKQMLISVTATRLNETTIEIMNWSGAPCERHRETCLVYPEFRMTYRN